MKINDPAVLTEVTEAFARYEAALVGNDVDVLDELFWADSRTVRLARLSPSVRSERRFP